MLLEKLYVLKDATMAELVEQTAFSQSSVRSILKDLESRGVLTLTAQDKSSGGRCPGRYSFAMEKFRILCVFIDEGTVEICLKDANGKELFYEHIVCEMNARLEAMLVDIVNEQRATCLSIASSGVVIEDAFYNDHGEMMEKQKIAINLKKAVTIPILIENDVKAMMMGIQAKQQEDSLAYLYFSQTGVGSAYYTNQQILRGCQAFSGELGLLPYQKQTINEVIASQPSIAALEDIYLHLLTTIAVTIDPSRIILAGKSLSQVSLPRIKKGMQNCLSKRYKLAIEVSSDPLSDALKGLHYEGILKLFDHYTEYKRSNNHE